MRGARTYETAAPYEQCADGREENTDDEQRRENGAGSEDGLPCLQSLLLEGGIYGKKDDTEMRTHI